MGTMVEGRTVPWRMGDLLAVIVLSALWAGVLTAIAAVAVGALGQDESEPARLAAGLAITLAVNVFLLVLVTAFSVRKYRCRWTELGFRRPREGRWWLALTTLVALWVMLGLYLAIVKVAGLQPLEPQATLDEDAFDTPLLMALAVALALVAAPIAEETFFRGFLFAGLRRRSGLVVAALVSGLLFGLLHFDPGSVIPFSLMGVILALAYAVSGSLWVTIASHFLFNLVSFLATIAVRAGGGG